jgi:ferric-dicitrate binding protein FerR (iron transport regulator)
MSTVLGTSFAVVLEDMADAIECKRSDVRLKAEDFPELLKRLLEECCGPESQRLPAVRVD